MKLHVLIQVACTGILKYCLREMLGKDQRETLFFFLDTLKSIVAERFEVSSLSALKEQVNLAIALIERYFPVAVQVSIMLCTWQIANVFV